ncbi:hypothetical protein [Massilia sp. TSP1-1-2]|uniref:hypothetical protein n=1 Tax=unclassified Massilia TaxID=2609279 RepID=UPI003CE754F5
MPNTKPFPDPATAHALSDEADIGSGEKTPGQLETEQMIREIPPLPPSGQQSAEDDAAGRDAVGAGRERREHDASLQRDEPADNLDALDPAPPEGN